MITLYAGQPSPATIMLDDAAVIRGATLPSGPTSALVGAAMLAALVGTWTPASALPPARASVVGQLGADYVGYLVADAPALDVVYAAWAPTPTAIARRVTNPSLFASDWTGRRAADAAQLGLVGAAWQRSNEAQRGALGPAAWTVPAAVVLTQTTSYTFLRFVREETLV